MALFALVPSRVVAAAAEPAADAAAAQRADRVEQRLRPAARIAGENPVAWTLAGRMRFYHVPGVSIAVVNEGAIEWMRSYGVESADTLHAVTPDTIFQAASISKILTAAAALSLVDEGKLALDEDVNARLRSWKIPDSAAASGTSVTLRQLLSHTAGMSVPGFPGYAPGDPCPTLLQVLNGAPPANSDPVRVIVKPGTLWRYSGGGYCLIQQLLVDVTGRDFPALLQDRVLLPAGMKASTFAQPLPASATEHAASGHRSDGTRVAGGAHVYPELAAAGLWTTAGDLARFALALQHSLAGGDGLLSPAMARAMTTTLLPGSDYGLGIGVKGAGENLQLSHGGANEGFRSSLIMYPRLGRGVVILTNSDNGAALIEEILRAMADEYDWPDYRVIEKSAVTLPAGALDDFTGRYERDDETLRFFRDGDRFYVKPAGRPRRQLFAQSDHEFFVLDGPDVFSFERGESGQPTHVVRRAPSPQIYRRVF